ncbi:MAG: hypothetical protein AAF747_01170, partial [Planctomycetota bacterium]
MPSNAQRSQSARAKRARQRGVATVIGLMFVLLVGSLVAAMAASSRGNIRTADTHARVRRAMAAAETGMQLAEQRLAKAASRFVVSQSEITPSFFNAVWTGGTIGDHVVLGSDTMGDSPAGIAQALINMHALDGNLIIRDSLDIALAGTSVAWPATDAAEYRPDWWVTTPIVGVDTVTVGEGGGPQTPIPPGFQIAYAPLADGVTVRIIAIGYDFAGNVNRPVTRTIMRDFSILKKVEHAIISPSRVLFGKNVQIVGDLGTTFEDTDFNNADPVVMRSDFRGLEPLLDAKLDALYASLQTPGNDVDGDNRFRIGHPVEGGAIPGDYVGSNGDPDPAAAFGDAT